MSNKLTAFLGSIGVSAWVFSKVYKSTGGNTKSSLAAAIIAGILVFMLFLTILWQIN